MTEQAKKGEYTPEQWAQATILHFGPPTGVAALDKRNHAIPVRKPDGTPDPGLMRAAVRALVNSGAEQDQKRDAARVLVGLYNSIDDNPPDSLKGLAGQVSREFSAGGPDEGFEETPLTEQPGAVVAMSDAEGAVSLADLDRQWVRYQAKEAQSIEGGPLDPAKVWEFAQERGIGISEAYAVLGDALSGEYEGDAEALRESTTRTGAARRKAEREDKPLGQAAVELAGTAAEAGSEHVADLADAYAEKHGVDYAEALVAVQKGRG